MVKNIFFKYVCKGLRPTLNFDPQGRSCPPGGILSPRGNFVPQGEFCPLGVKFSVRPSILLNSRQCSPPGGDRGVEISTRGQISPLATKLTPRGEVKNGPLFTQNMTFALCSSVQHLATKVAINPNSVARCRTMPHDAKIIVADLKMAPRQFLSRHFVYIFMYINVSNT
jgi:hypothetical protein